jgi:hypothetical protein
VGASELLGWRGGGWPFGTAGTSQLPRGKGCGNEVDGTGVVVVVGRRVTGTVVGVAEMRRGDGDLAAEATPAARAKAARVDTVTHELALPGTRISCSPKPTILLHGWAGTGVDKGTIP